MIEYFVMVDRTSELDRFNRSVKDALNNGWKLQGNLVIALDALNREWVYQAMIRNKNEQENWKEASK